MSNFILLLYLNNMRLEAFGKIDLDFIPWKGGVGMDTTCMGKRLGMVLDCDGFVMQGFQVWGHIQGYYSCFYITAEFI